MEIIREVMDEVILMHVARNELVPYMVEMGASASIE